jgi:hypothetical protein
MPKFHRGTANSSLSAAAKGRASSSILSQAFFWAGVSGAPLSPAYFASIASPSNSGISRFQTSIVSTVSLGREAA